MDKTKISKVISYIGCATMALGLVVAVIVNVLGLIFNFPFWCFLVPVVPLLISAVVAAVGWLIGKL